MNVLKNIRRSWEITLTDDKVSTWPLSDRHIDYTDDEAK